MKAKQKKQSKLKNTSSIISGGIIAIGMAIIILLIAVLIKLNIDEKKYTISYRDDTISTEQIKQIETNEQITETTTEHNQYITVEKALEIALSNLGISKQDVWDINVELEHKFGQVVYEIDFNANQYEYEYYINAENGEIIKSFKEIDY